MSTGAPDPANGWLELVIKLAAVIGIVGGLCVAGWKWVRRAIAAFIAADNLAGVFGHQAGHELRRLLAIISRSDSEQQIRQRVVESHLRIGVYECGLDGKCLWTNPHLAEMFGLDKANMLGYGWLAGIVNEERADAQKRWHTSVKLGLPYDDVYTVENGRTGDRFQCRTRAELVSTGGEPLFYIGWVIRDEA